MLKNNKIAQGVRLALIASATTSALAMTSVYAAEKEVKTDEIEKIEVTGSRIKRTDMEGISPITVISREDLDVSGEVSVADVLRNSNFNSFGSAAESSGQGGGGQGIATIDLRGLGADRSLVLINGKRVAPSPASGGGSANINAIPMAAVDRIEIVSAGASAVYGSDAIGGVVNVILRKDFEGVSVSAVAGRPSLEGGDENSVNMVMGLSNDKGSFIMSVEHSDREIIYTRDREYTKSVIGATANDNINVSSSGRNVQYWLDHDGDGKTDQITWRAVEEQCDTSNGFVGVQEYTGSQAGTKCQYDYTSIMAETAELQNQSMYARGVYEINDSLSFNLNMITTRFVAHGRFAPAAGSFNVTGTELAADQIALADDSDILYAQASWRFTDNGPRDTRTDGFNIDTNMYLDGTTDWGNWTVGYHRNVATITELGNGYINEEFAVKFAAEGSLSDARSVDLMAHTISTFNKVDYAAYSAGVGIDSLMSLPAGEVGAYFMMEHTNTTYQQDSDALSDAVAVIGSAGGSANGERQVTSVSGEILIPATDKLEFNIAARYDDYSDFGDNLSPQIGATYTLSDDWKVRTGVTKGFRAPTFSNMYSNSQSFSWVYIGYWDQYETQSMGNELLEPETSTQFNVGIIGDITDNLSMTLDYQKIEIKDMIRYEGAGDIWDKKKAGISLLPGTSVVVESGLPSHFVASYVNQGEMSASYVDFNLTGTQETSFGTFKQKFDLSYTVDYSLLENTPDADGVYRDVLFDYSGIKGSPAYRASLAASYSYEDHELAIAISYIPTQKNALEMNKDGTGYNLDTENDPETSGKYTKVDSYTDISMNYQWHVMDGLTFNVGARNLMNEEPRFKDTAHTDYSSNLYSLQGRTIYTSVKYDF